MAENGPQQPGAAAGHPPSQASQAHGEHTYSGQALEAARAGVSWAAHSAADHGQDAARHFIREPAADVVALLREYARQKPDVAALWCFGLGIIVGWKLKP